MLSLVVFVFHPTLVYNILIQIVAHALLAAPRVHCWDIGSQIWVINEEIEDFPIKYAMNSSLISAKLQFY